MSTQPQSPEPTGAGRAPSARPERGGPGAATTSGTLPRWSDRPTSRPLAKVSMVTFGIGLLAIVVTLVLFAAGEREFPLWLNLLCILAPIGFGIGLFGVFREARTKAGARLAQRSLAAEAAAAKAAGAPSEEWNLPDRAVPPTSS